MSSLTNVFTYGSLVFPIVWQRVVRGDYVSSPATVQGFRRLCVGDREHPALVIARGVQSIPGRVYFEVSAADIARLDYFETSHYERVTVSATVGSVALSAQAYLALNTDSLLDKDWNMAQFERVGLPVFLATYAVQNAPPD